jgi:hypothetical protein
MNFRIETIFFIIVVILLYFFLYRFFFRYFYIKSIEKYTYKDQKDRYYFYKIEKKKG